MRNDKMLVRPRAQSFGLIENPLERPVGDPARARGSEAMALLPRGTPRARLDEGPARPLSRNTSGDSRRGETDDVTIGNCDARTPGADCHIVEHEDLGVVQ